MLIQAIPRHGSLTTHQLRAALTWSGAVLVLVALPLLWMIGAMKYFILALAGYLALLVWRRPWEATSAGILYILACTVFLPSSARLDWQASNWEMYYWAAGSLIVATGATLGIGPRRLVKVPISAKVFLVTAFVATFTGTAHGASFSFAFRQLFGSLLFVLYFAFALSFGEERLFFRRLRNFSLFFAGCFFIYYIAVFAEYGFHKEMSEIGTLFGVVAILCFVKAIEHKSGADAIAGLILTGVPVLLFWRHVILAVAFAIAVALAVTTASRLKRFILCSVAGLILLPSMFPGGAEFVLERLMANPIVEKVLPPGTRDVSSLLDRDEQLLVAVDIFRASPLLGSGFGTELEWDSPVRGVVAQAFVDNGWAYLVVKIGGIGLAAFSCLLFAVLRCLSRESLAVSVAFVTVVVILFFSEPVLLQFSTSPLAGSLAGLLVARKGRKDSRAPLPAHLEERFEPA